MGGRVQVFGSSAASGELASAEIGMHSQERGPAANLSIADSSENWPRTSGCWGPGWRITASAWGKRSFSSGSKISKDVSPFSFLGRSFFLKDYDGTRITRIFYRNGWQRIPRHVKNCNDTHSSHFLTLLTEPTKLLNILISWIPCLESLICLYKRKIKAIQ